MVVLDEKQILNKCRVENLSLVRNLNLWGCEIDDLSILKRLPNVEVLSLSMNNIITLRDFGFCTKLSELYLRKNKIADISEVRYLVLCTHLKVLWLSENPCADHPNYRTYIISQLPQLIKLDNTDVTQEERNSRLREILVAEPKDSPDANELRKDSEQKLPRRANSPSQSDFIQSPQTDQSRKTSKVSENPNERPDQQGRRLWKAQNPVRLSEVIRQAGDRDFTPEEKAGTLATAHISEPASRRMRSEPDLKPPDSSTQTNAVYSAILTLLGSLNESELTLLHERVTQKIARKDK